MIVTYAQDMPLPAPMLPMPGPLPNAAGWAYEFKWDGVRAIIAVHGGRLRIQTRRGNEVADRFPELAAITAIVEDAIFDGEAAVFAGQRPDFGATVARLRARPAKAAALAEDSPATMLAFDVLRLNGTDLRGRPYEERRALLEGLDLAAAGWVVPPVSGDGPATMAASLAHGLEGVVAKRRSSRYVSGRSRHWVKTRHRNVIDAVIVGWAPSSAGGHSLLLAEHTSAGLVYRGRCAAPDDDVLSAMEPLATANPPVTPPGTTKGVQWVRPELEVEIEAASRRPDGRLCNARFIRVRWDLQ